ncbi:MAG: short-chain dehydrogenase [Aestuariibaculum sp.]
MDKQINTLILLFISLFFIGCFNKEKTDSELLEIDKKQLEESIDAGKVSVYKFGKILIRSAVEKNKNSPDFVEFKADLDKNFNKIINYNNESLSVVDYIQIYRDYKKAEDFIMKTNEDDFPTLTDTFFVIYGDSIQKQQPFLSGDNKVFVQNMEHAVLSAITVLTRSLGKEVSLYECSKTNPDLLPEVEVKTLLQFFRGFLFFEKNLLYLSEDEFTRNINWLNQNKGVDLDLTRIFFGWQKLDNNKTHLAFHSFNHLFRGFDRLMMEREIDEERALADFEIFLKDAQELGIENELIWAIEVYLYTKKEDNEKAIASLKKLQTSVMLSSNEKESIAKAIAYLENRENGKMLNGVYDKIFMGKIAVRYMLNVLEQVDWKKVLKENNVPYVDEMFQTVDKLIEINTNLDKYTSTENLKETGKELKETGKDFWNKAKELVE